MSLSKLGQSHHNLLIALSQRLEVVLDHMLECSAESANLVTRDHNHSNENQNEFHHVLPRQLEISAFLAYFLSVLDVMVQHKLKILIFCRCIQELHLH